jgi:uncharacterized membrane protein
MIFFPRFVFPWMLIFLALVPWTIYVGMHVHSLTRMRKAVALTLRTAILLCLIFALAGAELVRKTDNLSVFFLLDQSNSVPEEQRLLSAQWVRNMADAYMGRKDQAGVIVFGQDASIELGMDPSLGLRDIQSYVGGEQTDMAAAIRLAMAAFPQGTMKRIVLFSDGNETQGSALEEAKLARAAGVAVDVVPLRIGGQEEVRLREVSTPSHANAQEPFQVRVVAQAEQDGPGTLRVFRRTGEGRQLIATQDVTLQKGDNTYLLTEELVHSGFYEYEAVIEAEFDTVLANNEGRAFTVVQGEPRVLYVEGNPQHSTFLAPALLHEGLKVDMVGPSGLPGSLATLQNYDVVILSDVGATDVSADQLKALEAMVRDLGIGLVMVGGPNSFGAGGYMDTAVEKALPVTMDIKQRKVMPQGALVLIMHTCEIPNGNAWARDIGIASLNVLSSQDLMGMLGYMWNTGDSWIFPLQPVGDKSYMRQMITQASTQIGDMPDVTPSLRMAHQALAQSTASVKRVIMISDGDPARPPASLLSQMAQSGINVSTVCIAPHSPNDSGMLQWVAQATGGNFYMVTNANNLPQIFTKEAAVVRKAILNENPFTPQPQHDSELLYGILDDDLPRLYGYVLTSPKDSSTIALVSEEGDPVLAHWRYGLGKAVAFTSDVTTRWATDWVGWQQFNRFWAQTVRWATRQMKPTNFRIDTWVRDGRGHVRVDAVDDEGRFINYLRPRGVATGPAPDYRRYELDLAQTAPGIYEAQFPLNEQGVYMLNLTYTSEGGGEGMMVAGLALGYSREYEYNTSNIPLLEQVAAVGGGEVINEGANPFVHNLVATPSVTPIWHFLVLLAACLLPLEVFVRRVVVPVYAVYAWAARWLRKVPALGKWVPAPALRPAPATGAYGSAAVARQFRARGDALSFGIEVRAPLIGETGGGDGHAGDSGEPAAVKTGHSEYTSQLLAAKERAIAKKTRRIESDTQKEKP